MARSRGAIFIKFGRAPATCRILRLVFIATGLRLATIGTSCVELPKPGCPCGGFCLTIIVGRPILAAAGFPAGLSEAESLARAELPAPHSCRAPVPRRELALTERVCPAVLSKLFTAFAIP